MRIRMTVAYNGKGYCGWQKQSHGPTPSIQQVLEKALSQLFQEEVSLFASGRTDAGVHALAQVCHFEVSDKHRSKLATWDLRWSLRSVLPPSIVVKNLWLAAGVSFHSVGHP